MLPQLRGDEALRYSYGVPPASPPLPAEHEMEAAVCATNAGTAIRRAGSQDAWFDSKPDDKPDDEYIKWRNRPSSCTPATADAESALPSGEPARPMVVFDSDAELQLSMPNELSDAVTQIKFLVV